MAKEKAKITTLKHPTYGTQVDLWIKYRAAFEGGMTFVLEYLKKYSTRESPADFELRQEISYCPAHAKAAIMDVKNNIYQRLNDVQRVGGPPSYQEAIKGTRRGVDLQGRSMGDFIGTQVLQELIVLGKVGVYVDKPKMEGETLKDSQVDRPYLYYYTAEQILSWAVDADQNLTSLLLQDTRRITDEEFGLVMGTEIVYRHLRLTDEGVQVTFYNTKDEKLEGGTLLALTRIPFVLFEISTSLMTDIADYQVALLNLASSDMVNAKGNFPFYVEQYAPTFDLGMLKQADPDSDGTEDEANKSKDKAIDIGAAQGRRYPTGMDQPAFIHPSSEPLIASMQKQDRMIKEIREIINLSITNLEPSRESAESKDKDNEGLEAGLATIGMELNYGEREIAAIWAEYEGSGKPAVITYPDDYKLLTDAERRAEAKDAEEMMGKIPSHTYKQVMAKKIVKLTLGNKATPDTLEKINTEIDSAEVIISDPATIRSDHEAGLVSDELASKLRGYPEGEYKKAQADHAERATRILAAQTSNVDLGNDPDREEKIKANEQNPDLTKDGSDGTRGEGK